MAEGFNPAGRSGADALNNSNRRSANSDRMSERFRRRPDEADGGYGDSAFISSAMQRSLVQRNKCTVTVTPRKKNRRVHGAPSGEMKCRREMVKEVVSLNPTLNPLLSEDPSEVCCDRSARRERVATSTQKGVKKLSR